MSGNAAKPITQALMYMSPIAAVQAALDTGATKPIGKGARAIGGAIGDTAGKLVQDISGEDYTAPNIAEDPNAVLAADAKKKAAQKRQAQIEIMQDRPGNRSGTILTDNYTYQV